MKEEYINLLKKVNRPNMDKLIEYLDEQTDFFTSPASSKYHLSKEGGLLKHSLNVYQMLQKEMNDDNDSIIITSLLHDICKANYYVKATRNVKNSEGKYVPTDYYTINELLPMGHGEKSVYLISKFITLTDEEACAIRWHMGAYEPKENYNSLASSYKKYPLSLYLHIADLKATYLLEKDEE